MNSAWQLTEIRPGVFDLLHYGKLVYTGRRVGAVRHARVVEMSHSTTQHWSQRVVEMPLRIDRED